MSRKAATAAVAAAARSTRRKPADDDFSGRELNPDLVRVLREVRALKPGKAKKLLVNHRAYEDAYGRGIRAHMRGRPRSANPYSRLFGEAMAMMNRRFPHGHTYPVERFQYWGWRDAWDIAELDRELIALKRRLNRNRPPPATGRNGRNGRRNGGRR